jgi:hypothetical protein
MTAPLRASHLANAEPIDRRGRRLPETLAALVERDRLLVEAARQFCFGESFNAAALTLHTAIARYRETRWQYQRSEQWPRHRNPLNFFCWRVLKAHDATPSARTIRRVLAAFRGQAPAVDCAIRTLRS